LPPCVDDYVADDNLARAIDACVDSGDLEALGFANTQPARNVTGQPAFDPSDLLKLYLYGSLPLS
jgi:transposase